MRERKQGKPDITKQGPAGYAESRDLQLPTHSRGLMPLPSPLLDCLGEGDGNKNLHNKNPNGSGEGT